MDKNFSFYIYKGNYSYLIKNNLLKIADFLELKEEEESFLKANFIWKPTNFNQRMITILGRRKDNSNNLMINHLPLNNLICYKTGLYRTLNNYYNKNKKFLYKNYKVYKIIPISFLIISGNENNEFFNFIKFYTDISNKGKNEKNKYMNSDHFNENLWLIKPANMNQGKGIKIMNKLSNILHFIKKQKNNSFWLIQKYLEKPLLYKKRKFDIRVWVLVLGNFDIYIYKNPYIRTSSFEYEVKLDNNYIHLTNNLIQMKSNKYGEYEEANILTINEFEKYIKENINNSYCFKDSTFKDITNIIIDVINGYKFSNKLKIDKNYFELFGFDFMIDEFFQTWLIECNTNPHLGNHCKYLDKEVNNMIYNLLKIVLENFLNNKNSEKNLKNKFNDINFSQDSFILAQKCYFNNKNMFITKRTKIKKLLNNFSIFNFKIKNYNKKKSTLNLSINITKNKEIKSNNLKHDKEKIKSFPYLIIEEISKNNSNSENKLSDLLKNIINIMINWDLHDLKQLNYCSKSLNILINSGYQFLFSKNNIIIDLKKLILGESTLIYLQIELVKILKNLMYNNEFRKLLIKQNKFIYIIHIFVRILGNSINKLEKMRYPKEVENLSLEILIEIYKRVNNKIYIPGEIKDNEKINKIFYIYGINLIIYILYIKGENFEKLLIDNNFFYNYKKMDYQKDLILLNSFFDIINYNKNDLYLLDDIKDLFLNNFDLNIIKEFIINRLKKKEKYIIKKVLFNKKNLSKNFKKNMNKNKGFKTFIKKKLLNNSKNIY